MTIECPSCAASNRADAPACSACGKSLSTLAVGSVLASRYDLRSILDEGGMGSVYQAFDRKLEQEVAVKVFRTDLPSNTEAVRRFRAETDRVRAVSHPNVGRIHDHGESGAFGYISMDLLAGQDLRQVLRGQPKGLPESEALSAVLQIASGVEAIHEAGIPHGDLKTAQAVRDQQGVVRIVPFGMVKDPLSPNPAGEFLGTPEYMSPEHCWGYALDFRSDVYALGILAFEVFTGEVPIRGQNPTDTLFKQMREEPSFEAGAGSRVPRRFVPALARALAKAAPDRFASVREFAEALRAVAPEAQSVVPPASVPQTSSAAPPAPSPRTPAPNPAAPQAQVPSVEPPRDRSSGDARKDERFTIPTDVRIRKLGPGGVPQKEERTIAHDLSRSGMRVLTSWSDLAAGDEVAIEEVGGNFSTGAVVRHVNRGSDQITRVGIEFLEKRAPDRLVGTTMSIPQSAVNAARSSPGVHATGSNPIPPPGASGSTPKPGSTRSIPRPRNTGSTSRPRNTGSTSRPRATGSTPRSALTSSIPRSGLTTSIARPAPASPVPASGGGDPSPPPRDLESVREEIASARVAARELIGESKIWEALECLAKAQALAEGTPEAHAVRILTCETQAKVPSLMRAAQQTLEDMARDDPRDVAVHSALGRMFWQAGLSARARVAFKHVLVLDPSNREATAAIAALNDPTKRR